MSYIFLSFCTSHITWSALEFATHVDDGGDLKMDAMAVLSDQDPH